MNYSITFSGNRSKVNKMKRLSEGLEEDFKVQFAIYETFSNAPGPAGPDELEMLIRIGNNLLDFIEICFYKKGVDLILKESLFNPIYKWLETLHDFDDDTLPDELEFRFDDFKIRVGYSKRNHQNIVGQIILILMKISQTIKRDDLGKLTGIATPVRLEDDNEWRFFKPEHTFKLNDYLTSWGLEYNSSNRCILEFPDQNFIFKHWWG